MQLDWWTLALQALNFLILVWLLWRFLYRPVKEVIARRKALTDEAFAEAAKAKEDAEKSRQQFEESKEGLASERREMLKKIHEEQEAERARLLDEARDQAAALIDEGRKTIAGEREAALDELRDQAAALAVDLAATLLKEAGADAPMAGALAGLEKEFTALSDEERERLKADLAANGAELKVVTAQPLATEDQDRWRQRIAGFLDCDAPTSFVTDPAILGGAELRFPHALIRASWANHLEQAKKAIRGDASAS